MNSSAQFNALPLLSVKPALDDALDKIGRALEQFFASNGEDQKALQEAIEELHRTYGVLRMLSLDGVIVFCSELEKLLQEFVAGSLQASAMHHEVIQRALLILTHFLGSLADGAPNVALRLFDPYQELLQARGIEAAFAVDLFFPPLNIELPSAVRDTPLQADATAHIKAARSQYQQSLLKWLRQDNAAEALQTMHAAVQAVMACVPPDNRAFWWIAAGLLDCLVYDGLPPELSAKKMLGRIDLRMKALVEGTVFDERAALNEMLYLVACSHAVSEAVEEIKRRYLLDEYLPDEPPLPPGETAQVLEQMRGQLNGAEESWEKCIMQDEAAFAAFAGQAEQLQALSEKLDRNTLQLLCKQIYAAAAHIGEPEYRQRIRMDMAMALILLDSGIAHYANLGDNFHEQVRILGQRLPANVGEAPEVQELVPLHCRMAQREIIPLLVEAMSNNLEQVEQELNIFFGNPEKREQLALLVRLLNQVQGCLHMLSLDVAEELLKNSRQAVARYAEGGKLNATETQAIATAISALGAYINDLTYGQKPDSTRLQEILQELTAPPPEPPAAAPAPAEEITASGAVVVQLPATEDNEMLEVFLEEAQEVLGILRSNLELSQLHPDSNEPLITMRRGFHTLKGSGRMVGLNDLGEVAWAVERAMNKWLQENKPATPGLLQFVADAESLFHAWVDSLTNRSGAMINTTSLVAAAQQIENGEDPPAPATTAEPEMAISFDSLGLSESVADTESATGRTSVAETFTLPDFAETSPQAAPAPESGPEPERAISFDLPELSELATEIEPPVPPVISDFTMPDLPETIAQAAPAAAPETTISFGGLEFPLPNVDVPQVEQSRPASVSAPAPMSAREPESEADAVTIGKITLSASLFEIATEESASNLAKLQNYFAELRASTPLAVNYDFMRAAHTLAGVNRTMGFVAVADLSRALELWLEARIGKIFTLRPEQIALLEEAITTLDAMFLDICNHQEPQTQLELIARLHANQESLIVGEATATPFDAVPVEASREVVAEETPLAVEPQMNKVVWGAPAQPIAPVVAEPVVLAPDEVSFDNIFAAVQESPPQAEPKPITSDEASLIAVSFEEILGGSKQPPAKTAPEIVAPDETPQETAQEAAHRIRQYVEERAVQDDLDEQLLPIFLEESNDLQPQIGKTLRAWREDPDDARLANELQRGLHTLKGSARMAGVMRLGELTHRMEDRVVAGMSKALRSEALWDELDSYFDRISNALERLRSGNMEPEQPEAATAAQPEQVPAAVVQAGALSAPQAAQAAKTEATAERAAAMLRVRSDVVDRLVNEAGEISVARSRMETELRAFKVGLSDMTESVIRLRGQLREIEIQAESQMEARVALAQDMAEKFDPLEFDRFTRFQELTRFMGESVHDVQTVQQTLMKNLDETASALSAQAYLNRDLQQSLMAIRMVPFAGISDRLYRIVRQTAKELHKRANLDLKGTEVELDRSVLDKMTAPFEHILRNAIAHGLESPEQRNRKHKSPIGQIQIALTQESNEVVFDIMDDGAGLNLDRLREKALENGLVPAGAEISDDDAMQLIFNSGLSTATEVTEVSGRGVGMDVVRNEITSLGGQISVRTERGKGTRFTIRLPLTLAVTQVLMMRAAHEQFAVPSVMVEQVLHIKPDAMENAYMTGQVLWQGRAYPLKYLPHLLGNEKHVPEKRMHNPVLLLQSAEQRVALHVDELMGNHEAVVKNIGPQLARLPGVAGATVLGNGQVVLILNPVALAQPTIIARKEAVHAGEKAAKLILEEVEAPPLQAIPLVMVVDDSLTVRKVTTRMLTRAGYEVATAKDGVDALEQLTEITPDVMLLDVEMPRMDGFELTRQIRRDPKLHKLPILMITSRTAEKHRDYALELGVNAYFGKPFQEEELLQQIAGFVNQPSR